MTPIRLETPDRFGLALCRALGLDEDKLLLELLSDSTLEAEESGPEVVEDVRCTETISSRVVGGVHRVHDYKHVLVHLRQWIE
jgi:hypothetical protein